jgi:hypothetical protein
MDKIHSTVHAQDSLMGMLIKNLKQIINVIWIVNARKMKSKILKSDGGSVIEALDDINNVVRNLEMPALARDIYNGLTLFRQMGQNASGISDIASGVAQEGVETLGEASILTTQAGQRLKEYLKVFENTFIEPLWQMRNQVNMRFVTDVGYIAKVIEDKIVNWRTFTEGEIRADVDFVCRASNREAQKAVTVQQVIQTLNVVMPLVEAIGPQPILGLLRKLMAEGFNWGEDEIAQVLGNQDNVNGLLGQLGQGGIGVQNQPQPQTEGQAIQSANAQFQTNPGQL